MKNVKIKFQKPNNPVVGCNKPIPSSIEIEGKKYSYNKVYKVEADFALKYKSIFKEIEETNK